MTLSSFKNLIIKAGTLKISLSFLFIFAIIFNLNQTIDTSSKQHIDKSFNRALITFGLAKTLNGVISVAQGTEIAIQPAGIGVNLTPGQILDPVNDLVERFSWIMLASTTSLGVQKVFLTMSVWPAFRYLVVVFLVLGLILIHSQNKKYFEFRTFVLRLSLLFIVFRFAVPIASLSNEMVYQIFLENEYVESSEELEITAQQINQLNNTDQLVQPDVKTKSVWESAKDVYKSTSDMLDINKKIDKYKESAIKSTRHIINLIVVFLFQTVIIPLGFIVFIFMLLKYIIRLNFNFEIKSNSV